MGVITMEDTDETKDFAKQIPIPLLHIEDNKYWRGILEGLTKKIDRLKYHHFDDIYQEIVFRKLNRFGEPAILVLDLKFENVIRSKTKNMIWLIREIIDLRDRGNEILILSGEIDESDTEIFNELFSENNFRAKRIHEKGFRWDQGEFVNAIQESIRRIDKFRKNSILESVPEDAMCSISAQLFDSNYQEVEHAKVGKDYHLRFGIMGLPSMTKKPTMVGEKVAIHLRAIDVLVNEEHKPSPHIISLPGPGQQEFLHYELQFTTKTKEFPKTLAMLIYHNNHLMGQLEIDVSVS